MSAVANDPSAMETDPDVLHGRIERLITLARKHGATHTELRYAIHGAPRPDRVLMPSAGRLPAIDPAPYLATMLEGERFRQGCAEGDPLCGVRVTEEASDQIRAAGRYVGITTCVLPAGHYRGWGEGSRPPHVGILITDPMPDPTVLGLLRYQWVGPVRELGQVAPR